MLMKETVIKNNYKDICPLVFGSEECEKNHSYGPHIRTYWLLHFIHSGEGEFTVDGKTHKIYAGDIFVIPPYTETFYKADSINPWNYTWIGFTAGIELPEAFGNPVINNKHSEKIFRKMLRCKEMTNGKTPYLCSCLWELISVLSEETKITADYGAQAKSIIDSEYMYDLTISDIAKRLNINRSYLFAAFRENEGISPQQYLIKTRLERAAELMTQYNEPVSVSAASSGYQDIYNFSKIFKAHFGVSPRKYCAEYKKTSGK